MFGKNLERPLLEGGRALGDGSLDKVFSACFASMRSSVQSPEPTYNVRCGDACLQYQYWEADPRGSWLASLVCSVNTGKQIPGAHSWPAWSAVLVLGSRSQGLTAGQPGL